MRGIFLQIILVFVSFNAKTQSLPVEVFVGNFRTSSDILWFRSVEKSSRFIFSNRSRYSVDYNNQTSYGFSSNLSYRFKSGLGIGVEAKVNAGGLLPQAGVIFYKQKDSWAVFSFFRTPVQKKLKADWLTIFRTTPALNDKFKLFVQSEFAILFASALESGIIRQRIGLSLKTYQFGIGIDINSVNEFFNKSTLYNYGGFIRKDL